MLLGIDHDSAMRKTATWMSKHLISVYIFSIVTLWASISVFITLEMSSSSQTNGRALTTRLASELNDPIVAGDIDKIRRVCDVYLNLPPVWSLQVHEPLADDRLFPIYSQSNSPLHHHGSSIRGLMHELIEPLFVHTFSSDIFSTTENEGRLSVRFHDDVREEVTTDLLIAIFLIMLMACALTCLMIKADRRDLNYRLIRMIRHAARTDRSKSNAAPLLNRYTPIGRVAEIIINKTTQIESLKETVSHLEALADRQKRLIDAYESDPQSPSGDHISILQSIEHTSALKSAMSLVDDLSNHCTNPNDIDSFYLLHSKLAGLSMSLQESACLTRHGRFPIIELIGRVRGILYAQRGCIRTLRVEGGASEHFQGRLSEVLHVTTKVILTSIENSTPGSAIDVSFGTNHTTHQLSFTCSTRDLTWRDSGYSEIAAPMVLQRKCFSTLMEWLESLDCKVETFVQTGQDSKHSLTFSVHFPLRQTKLDIGSLADQLLPNVKALYLLYAKLDEDLHNELENLYSQMGADVTRITVDDAQTLSPSPGDILVVPHSHRKAFPLDSLYHWKDQMMVLTHPNVADELPDWLIAEASLSTVPTIHFERFNAIASTTNVATLPGATLDGMASDMTSPLSRLLDQHAEQHIDEPFTLWVPKGLPGALAHKLHQAADESAIRLLEYYSIEALPSKVSAQDVVCIDRLLTSAETRHQAIKRLKNTGAYMIGLLERKGDTIRAESLPALDNIVDHHTSTGYISSILMARCGV